MKTSIGSDALKLTVSKIITMGISMVNAMLLSRFRTLEEYGTYSQLLLIVNIATTIFMMGLPNCINFFIARIDNEEEKQKFLSVYYTFSSILSFITGLVLVFSAPIFIKYFDNELINNYIYFLAIFPWTRIIMSSVENFLIVYNRTKHLVIYRVANVFALLFIIVVVKIFNLTFKSYMILFLIVESIFTVIIYIFQKNISGDIRILIDKNILKSMLKYSMPIGLSSVVGTLNIELDKLIIGNFYTTKELAIYTNSAKELPVSIIAGSLTAVLMPHLVRLLDKNKDERAIGLWKKSIVLSYIFIAIISFGIITYAPEVIMILYSEKYLPGINVFRIYSLVLLLRVTYFGMILNAKGKTKFIFYSSIISLIMNVIFNYFFYKIFGFIGPALATFVSISIVQFIQLIATSKTLKISLSDIFPWIEIIKITIFNIVFAIVFYYLKKIITLDIIIGNVLESLLLGVIWVIIYLFIFLPYIKETWNLLNNPDYQTKK